MAKINVTLRCQFDNGKTVKSPGQTVAMEEKEARKLAAMGMVVLPLEEEQPADSSGQDDKGGKGGEGGGENA